MGSETVQVASLSNIVLTWVSGSHEQVVFLAASLIGLAILLKRDRIL